LAKISEVLDQSSQLSLKSYQEALKNIQDEMGKVLLSVPNNINNSIVSAIQSFSFSLQNQFTNAQKKMLEDFTNLYKSSEADIENYKRERLKVLDSLILKVIEEVSLRVLGKEISVEEHEKLVLKALEEAKRKNALEDR